LQTGAVNEVVKSLTQPQKTKGVGMKTSGPYIIVAISVSAAYLLGHPRGC